MQEEKQDSMTYWGFAMKSGERGNEWEYVYKLAAEVRITHSSWYINIFWRGVHFDVLVLKENKAFYIEL